MISQKSAVHELYPISIIFCNERQGWIKRKFCLSQCILRNIRVIFFVRCHAGLNKCQVTFKLWKQLQKHTKGLKLLGNEVLSSKHVFEEFKDSKEESEDTEGDEKSGPLSTL